MYSPPLPPRERGLYVRTTLYIGRNFHCGLYNPEKVFSVAVIRTNCATYTYTYGARVYYFVKPATTELKKLMCSWHVLCASTADYNIRAKIIRRKPFTAVVPNNNTRIRIILCVFYVSVSQSMVRVPLVKAQKWYTWSKLAKGYKQMSTYLCESTIIHLLYRYKICKCRNELNVENDFGL